MENNMKKHIGVSINLGQLDTSLWSNGLFQNIYTLVTLLKNCDDYECSLIVSASSAERFLVVQKEIKSTFGIDSFSLVDVLDGMLPIDLLLECGNFLSAALITEIRASNSKIKIVPLIYGNDYFSTAYSLVKRMDANKSDEPLFSMLAKRDAVWVSPHFKFFLEWIKLKFDTDIGRIAPYVWDCKFIDNDIKNNPDIISNILVRPNNDIAVLESNITITKTSLIPAAIAETLYRKNKSAINKCKLFSAAKLLENSAMVNSIGQYNIVKDGKMTLEPRIRFVDIFSKYSGILLSHQHMNTLNYVYLEALHLGIPLVHNSKYFEDVGYYYEGFDIEGGSHALLQAINDNGAFSHMHNSNAKKLLWKYSPKNPININGYVKLIDEILT